MKTERIDEAFLVKYLLGDLSPDQEIQVEDRAFADAEYLTALETAEADLIDSYVRAELSPTERRRFESRFLVSPQRRRKVAFARDLAKVVAEVKASTPTLAPVSGWDAFVRLIRGWSPAFQFAMALAALVFVVGAVWLAIDNMAMRSQIANENRAPEIPKIAPVPTQPDEPKAPPENPKTTPISAIATLILRPQTREPGSPQQLILNTSTQMARIEIQLEAPDDYPSFRADLRTARGDEVLVRGNLRRVGTAAGGFSVSFEVPPSALDSVNYELALQGIRPGESPQDIGFYYFAVKKP